MCKPSNLNFHLGVVDEVCQRVHDTEQMQVGTWIRLAAILENNEKQRFVLRWSCCKAHCLEDGFALIKVDLEMDEFQI